MGFAKQLANQISNICRENHSKEMREQINRVVLDYYAALIPGLNTDVVQQVQQYYKTSGVLGGCELVGSDLTLPPSEAAFVYGTAAHALDLDDGHTKGSVHPGAPVLSALLAVASQEDVSVERFQSAIIAGYQTCILVAETIHPSSRKKGYHNTSVAGLFGACAAVGVLQSYNAEELEHALTIAISFAGGTFAFLGSGTEVKRIHAGQAARDGIVAAGLARAGLTGPKTGFENENGFFHVFGNGNQRTMAETDGWKIHEVYFKPYPCCRHLHSAIDAVFELKKREAFSIDQIRSMEIGVYEIASYHDHTTCTTLLDAQMSLPFVVAAACESSTITVEALTPANQSADVKQLMKNISVFVDQEAQATYPKERGAIVKIQLNNGKRLERRVRQPLGEPSNPLSTTELEEKLRIQCEPSLGLERVHQLIAQISKGNYQLEGVMK
ncbi:MmgE/PrpD family protein [Shouchella sp. JSM 1781072]|uniref:MmgE/PrpD family protein n=1 Tax=Shouchella sp. JSM 1781072 TaxID=3344581 RepID=UPI0035BFB1F8